MYHTKRIDGREFNILIQGSGEPFLFVHGFPLDHSMWNAQIAEFSKTHLVIAPDLRGFGASKCDDEKVTMLDYANDLAAMLDEFSIDTPVNLCGLSMGGYIAWQFYRNHRSKLKSIILCDTKAAADSEAAQQTRRETSEKVLQNGPGFLAEAMPEKLFSAVTLSNNQAVVEQTQSVIRSTSPQTVSAALLGMAERPDVTEMLPKIDFPTLVVVGEHDSITTSAEMQEIANTIPNADFIEIRDAGHMSPLEQPEQVNSAIADFLKNR